MQRPHALRFQTWKRVCNEGAVPQPLKAARATNPYIPFPVFEEPAYRSGNLRQRNSVRVVSKESAARAHPDVRVPVAKKGKYLEIAKSGRHTCRSKLLSIP